MFRRIWTGKGWSAVVEVTGNSGGMQNWWRLEEIGENIESYGRERVNAFVVDRVCVCEREREVGPIVY